VLALVAYDDCSQWLYEKPEIVRAYIAVSNDPAAELIYPFTLVNDGHDIPTL
jgi:hypothetical protein